MPAGANGRRALVRFLQRIGTITLAEAPDLEAASDEEFPALLERATRLDPAAMADRLAAELRLDRFDPGRVDPGAALALPQELAERHAMVVVRVDERVHVAMVNPLDLDAIKDVEFATRRRAQAVVATPDEVHSTQQWVYAGAPPPEPPPPAGEALRPGATEGLETLRALIDACQERIAVLERQPRDADPPVIARIAALEAVVAELQAAQLAIQDAQRDDVARLSAEQDALVAAQNNLQRELIDAAVRRAGEILLPRIDELAAGTLAAVDRADRAQRATDALGALIEETRAIAGAPAPDELLRRDVEAMRLEVSARLIRLDEALAAMAGEQVAQRAELARLGQHADAVARRTEGWASASDLRGLEAEQMALAAQLHRTSQGVEWARAGLAEARGEASKARDLAEAARRVAEASVPASALEAVRDALDARLRQVATQVARYEAGLGRLSGAQGDIEEALARVRAIAEETRRLTGMMATVERATALEAAIGAVRGEVVRLASIVDAPPSSLLGTAWAWGLRGISLLWSMGTSLLGMGRA